MPFIIIDKIIIKNSTNNFATYLKVVSIFTVMFSRGKAKWLKLLYEVCKLNVIHSIMAKNCTSLKISPIDISVNLHIVFLVYL